MSPIRPLLRNANFTEQQWRVLRVLAGEGEYNTTELSKASLLLAPSLTRILRELDDRGLITRRIDNQDGRRSFVQITEKGRGEMEVVAKVTAQVLATYQEAFGQARLMNLISELKALSDTLAKLPIAHENE